MKKIRVLALLCAGMFILTACGGSDSEMPQPVTSVEDEISAQEQEKSENALLQNLDNSGEDKYLALVYDSYAYGYIDENGEEVIECQFEYAKNFSHNGLAPVRDENDLWGYIDTEGNLVIDCIYEEAEIFTDNGLALVENKEGINDEGQRTYRCGFIDETGQTVVPFEYTDASDYKNGYARVQKDGLWGFVDESGEEIIPCQYLQVGDFASNGLAPVKNAEGLYGYINDKNEVIIDFQFVFAGTFGNNTDLAPVKNQDELCGYINSSGELIIDFIYGSVYSFDDSGCARVILPEDMVGYDPVVMGYINSDGVAITDNDLRMGYEFSENGLALVMKGEFGYINTDGEYVIPLEYDYATDFGDNGWAAVGWNGGSWEHEHSRLFYINENEEEVLACDQYEVAYEFVKVE